MRQQETHPANRTRKALLEDLYAQLNRRVFLHPDPLEFLYQYDDVADREIVGLIASSLAYGNVKGILRSVSGILELMDRPFAFVTETSESSLHATFSAFKYRFTGGFDVAELLLGARHVIHTHGSLQNCFRSAHCRSDQTVFPALCALVNAMNHNGSESRLLPRPERGSACKRLNLFLRWMVRKDAIDPGGWTGVSRAQLIIPLDTHIYHLARAMGFTSRRTADLKTALEITRCFRRVSPDDPLKYDFSLTRLGIRSDLSARRFLDRWRETPHD